MNPARAMGLFLRTWRREWAGLSRAQLALAVSHGCGGRRRVTPRVIEKWEAGQPPQSSEELTALLKVMGRTGLRPHHVAQFRQVVYAACAAHLYPDLLNGEDVAYRDDIEGIARRLVDPLPDHPPDANLVTLVAVTDELERTILGTSVPAGSPVQRRRQSVALACCRTALALSIPYWSPFILPYTPDLLLANAAFVEATFGLGGLGGPVSVLAQRIQATMLWAHRGRSAHHGHLLFAMVTAAEQRGEKREASRAFLAALHCMAEELEDDAPRVLEGPALRHLARLESLETPRYSDAASAHHDLAWASLASGNHAAAERWVAAAEDWMGSPTPPHPQTREVRAWLAATEGEWEGAEALHERECARARELAELGRPVSYKEWMRVKREQEDQKPRRVDGRGGQR